MLGAYLEQVHYNSQLIRLFISDLVDCTVGWMTEISNPLLQLRWFISPKLSTTVPDTVLTSLINHLVFVVFPDESRP